MHSASHIQELPLLELAKRKVHLSKSYDQNPYVKLLKMEIAEIGDGRAEILMPIVQEMHTNLYGVAHGGSVASLADTAMGVACATLGRRVVTLDLNINYLRGAAVQPAIRAIGTIIHNGSRTMVAECEVFDRENALLAKARATFFVIGHFEGV